jgi:hypothetical protein
MHIFSIIILINFVEYTTIGIFNPDPDIISRILV